jgi:hypothetical protein
LAGTLWETIGYMERTDQTGIYTWSEYLLFNPLKGFRWLTEYNGHWSFVVTTKDTPKKGNPTQVKYHNTKYQLFNKGTATVSYVVGEFYWQVRINEVVDLMEYISPPEILSMERSSEEIVWSIGQYTEADKVKEAFQIETPMPIQSGVAPSQPSTFTEETTSKIRNFWLSFLGILFFIQIGFCIGNSRETVYSGQIEFTPSSTEKTKATPSFEVKDRSTSLDIRFSSPVNNSWLEIGVDLVNDENGDIVEFEQGIEYYTGTDSDGAWTEGSTSTTEKVPSISKGKYHLNLEVTGPGLAVATSIDPLSPVKQEQSVVLDVEVKTGATLWSNFFLAVILLSLYPIFILWKRRRFEVSRWSESDFSPYNSTEEGGSE